VNGRVLAVLPEGRSSRAFLRALRATRSEIVLLDDLAAARQALPGARCDFVLLDLDPFGPDAPERVAELRRAIPARCPLVLLGAGLSEPALARLFAQGEPRNFLAKGEPLAQAEVVATFEKILRGDIFGLEKYLCWGIEPEAVVLRGSVDREHVMERLGTYLDELGLGSRFVDVARQVADEFVMNAVYNAPVTATGERPYAARSRTEPVALPLGQEAVFRYACDGRTLALSVRDPFGSLDLGSLYGNLARAAAGGGRQISQKQGGAGLGFFYILSAVHHFVVNLAPGRSTEMIGLLDVSGSFRDLAQRPKSLNVFLGGGRGGAS